MQITGQGVWGQSPQVMLLTVLLLFSLGLNAESLRFSFWEEATPPLAFVENGDLVNGIIKDIGDAISQELGLNALYIQIPVARIESSLLEGKIDFDCISNPIWKMQPSQYEWSPALFDGADRFLVRQGAKNAIDQFADLRGRTLGIYNGYVYHDEIMRMIAEQEINTVKVSDVAKGMLLLKLKRIDALVDFSVILDYELKHSDEADRYAIANKLADSFQLFCAYSPKLSIDSSDLDRVIQSLVDSGKIDAILSQYR